jgi:hypothetical protein
MLSAFPSWLTILFLFAGSLLFFTRIYRTAMSWFVRSRQNRQWEARAELATIVASAPFAFAFGLFSLEISLSLGRLALAVGMPLLQLPAYLDYFRANKFWTAAVLSVFHLLRTVPQTIASSKVYAYDLGENRRKEAPGHGG